MTVRVYRWDDASAPVLSASAGALPSLLKSVLVDGYGAKPAAGWTCPYDGSNDKGFTNARAVTPQGIKVTHTALDPAPRVVGYESISGTGVVTAAFPTSAQQSGGLYWTVSSTTDTTARPWMIVADQYRFHMWVGYNVATTTGFSVTTFVPLYFAGDLIPKLGSDAFHFLIAGNTSASVSTNAACGISANLSSTIGGHFLARGYSQSGAAIAAGKTSGAGITSSWGSGGLAYPDPVGGGMLLDKVRVTEPTVLRGEIPGLWQPLHSASLSVGAPGDTLSGTGELAGKTFILLDAAYLGTRYRVALETSDTWS